MLLKITRSIVVATLVVATAMVASSCTTGGPGPSGDYQTGDLRAAVDKALRSVNYPYDDDPTYAAQIASLQVGLIRQCVERNGLDLPDQATPPAPPPSLMPSSAALWLQAFDDYGTSRHLSDPNTIRLFLAAQGAREPGGQMMPDGYDALVYGGDENWVSFPIADGGTVMRPVGGCFGEATERMYGVDARTYERTRMELPRIADLMAAVASDETVRAATRAWSRCMADSGYEVKDPAELAAVMDPKVGEALNGSLRIADFQKFEQALAQADRTCKTESGLGTAAGAAFVDAAQEALAGAEGVVIRYREYVDHARAVMSES